MYAADSNPAVDPFSFKLSNERAKVLVASRAGRYITLACGRQAVQQFPSSLCRYPSLDPSDPAAGYALYPAFDLAWGIRPSGGVPVWQMNT